MLDEHLHHQQKTHPLWPGLLSAVVKQAIASLEEKIQSEWGRKGSKLYKEGVL